MTGDSGELGDYLRTEAQKWSVRPTGGCRLFDEGGIGLVPRSIILRFGRDDDEHIRKESVCPSSSCPAWDTEATGLGISVFISQSHFP